MTLQGKTKTLEKSRQFEITEKYKKAPQDADYIDGKQIDEMVPSLQCYIRCVGHSFPPMSQVFIPIVELCPSNRVCFAFKLINLFKKGVLRALWSWIECVLDCPIAEQNRYAYLLSFPLGFFQNVFYLFIYWQLADKGFESFR